MVQIPRTKDVPDFPVLDAGYYTVTICDVKERKQDKNGDEFISIEFDVEGHPGKVWDNFYLREDRLWKLKSFLRQIDENLTDVEFEAEKELIGKKVIAHIIPDKQWSRIREYVSLSQVNPKDLKQKSKEENDEDIPF
jgi:hypothetical protein